MVKSLELDLLARSTTRERFKDAPARIHDVGLSGIAISERYLVNTTDVSRVVDVKLPGNI